MERRRRADLLYICVVFINTIVINILKRQTFWQKQFPSMHTKHLLSNKQTYNIMKHTKFNSLVTLSETTNEDTWQVSFALISFMIFFIYFLHLFLNMFLLIFLLISFLEQLQMRSSKNIWFYTNTQIIS